MNLDFPQSETPRYKVEALARAIRTMKDPTAFTSQLIDATGQRIYRIVVDENSPPTPVSSLAQLVA